MRGNYRPPSTLSRPPFRHALSARSPRCRSSQHVSPIFRQWDGVGHMFSDHGTSHFALFPPPRSSAWRSVTKGTWDMGPTIAPHNGALSQPGKALHRPTPPLRPSGTRHPNKTDDAAGGILPALSVGSQRTRCSRVDIPPALRAMQSPSMPVSVDAQYRFRCDLGPAVTVAALGHSACPLDLAATMRLPTDPHPHPTWCHLVAGRPASHTHPPRVSDTALTRCRSTLTRRVRFANRIVFPASGEGKR
jgi:hypothetical protein